VAAPAADWTDADEGARGPRERSSDFRGPIFGLRYLGFNPVGLKIAGTVAAPGR